MENTLETIPAPEADFRVSHCETCGEPITEANPVHDTCPECGRCFCQECSPGQNGLCIDCR
jgi:hypothetical protein